MTFAVAKRNGRLWLVIVETEEAVYTPPDFIRITSRVQLKALAMILNEGGHEIDSIRDWESCSERVPLPPVIPRGWDWAA